jgi:hypothetical protein
MEISKGKELQDAKSKLKEEEYKLRWGGYLNPYDYVTSAQFTVVQYWKRKVEELEKELENE